MYPYIKVHVFSLHNTGLNRSIHDVHVCIPAVEQDGALVGSVVFVDFVVELQQRRRTFWHLVVWP